MLAAIALVFVAFHGASAGTAALDGKASLLRAERLLGQRKLPEARAELVRAQASFVRSRSETRAIVRYVPVVRAVPLVGSQVRGVEAFAEAGVQLADAGVRLADAASVIVEPQDESMQISAALGELRDVRGLLQEGILSIDIAVARVDSLQGDHLIRPLGRARTDLARRLPEIRARAIGADEALASLITFAGGEGPRRYLVLSQNPDEVRPSGGFIGTYGVLEAVDGRLELKTYDAIEAWTASRPQAIADPTERGSPLRFDTRIDQTLANVNTSPDWPQAAALAAKLWERGGEAPVQGVVSFTPAFLGRVLQVLGPVRVEEQYNETISAANVVERLDYWTHQVTAPRGESRKDFVSALALQVMTKLFNAPASKWDQLAESFGKSMGAREAMAWSTDAEVARVLGSRGWDGSMPATVGDFVYPSEFEYSAKNGRQLRRTYDHHVAIKPDGSARITTKVTVSTPERKRPFGTRRAVSATSPCTGRRERCSGPGPTPWASRSWPSPATLRPAGSDPSPRSRSWSSPSCGTCPTSPVNFRTAPRSIPCCSCTSPTTQATPSTSGRAPEWMEVERQSPSGEAVPRQGRQGHLAHHRRLTVEHLTVTRPTVVPWGMVEAWSVAADGARGSDTLAR